MLAASAAADRVGREDILMFVNAAIASTAQTEFRSSSSGQRMSLEFLHTYVAGNYRDLYAAALALEINHLNAAMIVLNLLRTPASDPGQRHREGRLIAARLRLLPPQRVYALIASLRTLGVNNRRTRAIISEWVTARPDLTLDAVKYRRSLSVAARHAHLDLPSEVGTALFDWRRPKRFQAPLLEAWRRAHYDRSALFELPYTVAEGLAVRHRIDRKKFLAEIEPRLTAGERLRLQASAAGLGVERVAMDLGTARLTRLALYVLSLPRLQRSARRDELTTALRRAAHRAAGRRARTWGRVVAVLDDSYSSVGSQVKRRRPLAVALAAHYLFEALAAEYTGLWLTHRGDPLLIHPLGATALGERVLDGLELRPDRLVIVSDGWDNAPPGQAAEVLRVWRTRLDPSGRSTIVHLNPVYDDAGFDVHRLSPDVATVGLRDAEDAPALVELSRFATGAANFEDLRRHMAERVDQFLSVTDATAPTDDSFLIEQASSIDDVTTEDEEDEP
ncbi:MAG TPA: hypothetical protein VH561_21760 [Micromonosporaceae bacterium]